MTLMPIVDYLLVLLRRWWLVVLPVIAVIGLTIATYAAPGTAWQSKMSLQIGLPPEPSPTEYSYDGHYNWLASEYLTRGIADLLNTSVFAENVAARLTATGQTVTASQVQSAIARDYRGTLVTVFVTGNDPAIVTQMSEAITADLATNASQYFPQLRNSKTAPFQRLDKPAPYPIATNLRNRFEIPARLLIALLVGTVLALIAHLFDPVVHGRRELSRVGISVMGEIPKAK